jgi:hypothetical protein
MATMGNPFMVTTSEVVKLDTHDVMDEAVANSIRNVEAIGIRAYEDYKTTVLTDRTKSIHDRMKRNSLLFFKQAKKRDNTKDKSKT